MDKQTNWITPISTGTWLWSWSISLPSFNSIGESIFELESRNGNVDDKQMDKKRTNEQTELHQFRKEPSYDGVLSPCQVWIQLDKAFST